MKLIATIAKELFGLFVDDGSLALAILAWVAVMAAVVAGMGWSTPFTGAILFAGLVGILVENVLRRARGR